MLQQPAGMIALQQVTTQRTPTPCLQVVFYTLLVPSAHYDKVIYLCARQVLTSRAQTLWELKTLKGFLSSSPGLLACTSAGWKAATWSLMNGITLLQCFAVALCLAASAVSDAARSFSIHNNNFVKDSKNFQIISGR